MLDSDWLEAAEVGCDVVSSHCVLGVLLDSGLTFLPLLRKVLAIGWNNFLVLYHTAESGGFSVPVVAAQVVFRAEPGVLYASAFLLLAPKARQALNNLQYRWARKLLGCSIGPHTNWTLTVAACGWTMRLGTRMLENAIVARARAWLLLDYHPVSPLMAQACMLPCLTWAASVSAAMQAPDLPENIPEILNCGACTPAELTQAKSDSDVRKIILKNIAGR